MASYGASQPAGPEFDEIVSAIKPGVEEKSHQTFAHFKAVEARTDESDKANHLIKIDVGDDKFIHVQVHGNSIVGVQTDRTRSHPLDAL